MNQKPVNSPESQAQQHLTAEPKNTPDARESGYQEEQDDPVWSLLGKGSTHEPSSLFARNVIRETRRLENPARRASSSFFAIFTPTRLALGAATCALAMATYQMWPGAEAPLAPGPVVSEVQDIDANTLTELVIEESLNAAAEDPTLFTRDEVVAMIGF
jgi:hypothetical protein